jgi:membrane associated rhomboid family serine protease
MAGYWEISERAPVSTTLIVLNVGLFLYTLHLSDGSPDGGDGLFGAANDVLLELGGAWREALWLGDWRRLVMPMFLHGGLLHIGMNMYWLFLIGPKLEAHYGWSNFASIYILSGLGGICLSLILGGNLSVGASGAVFGLMGAALAIPAIRAYDWERLWKSSEFKSTLLFIALLFGLGFLIPQVDNWCHLGGLLLGFVFGLLFEYWRKHERVGFALVAGLLLMVAGLVVLTRYMYFTPHYHAVLAVAADEAGDAAAFERHRAEAESWGRWWRSGPGADFLARKMNYAAAAGEPETVQRYGVLLDHVAPGWFLQTYPGLANSLVTKADALKQYREYREELKQRERELESPMAPPNSDRDAPATP